MKKVIANHAAYLVLLVLLSVLIRMGKARTLILGFCLLTSFLLAVYKEKRQSAGGTAHEKKEQKRDSVLDILRIMASVFVIAVHTLEMGHPGGVTGTLFVVRNILLSCNGLFFLLAGALSFRYKEQTAGAYYYERAVRIFVPMLVYYFWTMFLYMPLTEVITPSFLWSVLRDLFSGNVGLNPHFWILYPMMVIYLLAPPARHMMRELPYRVLTGFVVGGACVMLAGTLFGAAVGTHLPMWLFMSFAGCWLVRSETRKYDWIVVTAGGVSIVLMALFETWFTGRESGLHALIACAAVSGVYLILRKIHIGRLPGRILQFICRYSFGALLIHWWVIYYFTRDTFGLDASAHPLACILLSSVLSFLMAFLLDGIIVDPLSGLLKDLFFLGTHRKASGKMLGKK